MKKDIHPTYNNNSKVKCSCGNEFQIGSVLESIDVEICSSCHPFYSGEEKIIDTGGRVERFKRRKEAAKPLESSRTPKIKTVKIEKEKEAKGEEK